MAAGRIAARELAAMVRKTLGPRLLKYGKLPAKSVPPELRGKVMRGLIGRFGRRLKPSEMAVQVSGRVQPSPPVAAGRAVGRAAYPPSEQTIASRLARGGGTTPSLGAAISYRPERIVPVRHLRAPLSRKQAAEQASSIRSAAWPLYAEARRIAGLPKHIDWNEPRALAALNRLSPTKREQVEALRAEGKQILGHAKQVERLRGRSPEIKGVETKTRTGRIKKQEGAIGALWKIRRALRAPRIPLEQLPVERTRGGLPTESAQQSLARILSVEQPTFIRTGQRVVGEPATLPGPRPRIRTGEREAALYREEPRRSSARLAAAMEEAGAGLGPEPVEPGAAARLAASPTGRMAGELDLRRLEAEYTASLLNALDPSQPKELLVREMMGGSYERLRPVLKARAALRLGKSPEEAVRSMMALRRIAPGARPLAQQRMTELLSRLQEFLAKRQGVQ